MLSRYVIQDIRRWLKQRNYYSVEIKNTNLDSFPEIMAMKKGKVWFIKVIEEGKEPSVKQLKEMKKLEAQGFKVTVLCKSPEPLYKLKRKINTLTSAEFGCSQGQQ